MAPQTPAVVIDVRPLSYLPHPNHISADMFSSEWNRLFEYVAPFKIRPYLTTSSLGPEQDFAVSFSIQPDMELCNRCIWERLDVWHYEISFECNMHGYHY